VAEEFTIASMRRLLSKQRDVRISERSAEELRRVVGDYGTKIAKVAVEHCISEGRKTVLDRDIIAAKNRLECEDKNS
jgi:histone H3/H4